MSKQYLLRFSLNLRRTAETSMPASAIGLSFHAPLTMGQVSTEAPRKRQLSPYLGPEEAVG